MKPHLLESAIPQISDAQEECTDGADDDDAFSTGHDIDCDAKYC